jgi:hypothetical protein
VLLAVPLLAAQAFAADEVKPGAYCPLPKAGEKPSCLVPAQAEYAAFFRGIESGAPKEAQLQRVEAAVSAGSASENPFLALNALSYGYYVMAQAVVRDPESDPTLIAHLERWNDLLATAYAVSGENRDFRSAVHSAALDLRNRTPALGLRCSDALGRAARCDSTEAVLRGLGQKRETAGIRGALNRLIERLFADDAETLKGATAE